MHGVLILSNRRPDNVKTVKMLEKYGYHGEWRIVIDDQDPTAGEYERRYGDRVIVFDKGAYAEKTQTLTPKSDTPMNVVVYARNACPDISQQLGWDCFIELDDDYDRVEYRWIEGGKLKTSYLLDLDWLFSEMVETVKNGGLDAFGIAQGGDFIGGVKSTGATQKFLRKIMNVYCFPSDTKIRFTGYLNEDLTMSVLEGMKGAKILTCTEFEVHQTKTQKAKGGLTEEYLRHGTYAKSMCSRIVCPSCVSIRKMGDKHMRIHHNVKWNNAVPKIIRER